MLLILDDNKAILEVVKAALDYEGFEVMDISLGHQLFNAVKNFFPDLILLDYKLSDRSGGDLCAELKDSEAHRHIPVIIFSSYFNPGDKAPPLACDGILYKPFNLNELLEIVAKHLEKNVTNETA